MSDANRPSHPQPPSDERQPSPFQSYEQLVAFSEELARQRSTDNHQTALSEDTQTLREQLAAERQQHLDREHPTSTDHWEIDR